MTPVHGPKEIRLLAECILRGVKHVGTRGNVGAPVLFLGEAPGADEDYEGVPFCGPSGRLLDSMATEAGLSPSDFWFSNAYKCRPPDNDIDRIEELGIKKDTYVESLLEELHNTRPSFIVCVGATALGILCPDTVDRKDGYSKISHWRGSLLTSSRLPWDHYIFPIYHPAFILREWSEKYFNTFLLSKLKAELDYLQRTGKLQSLPSRELIVEPSFAEAYEYLQEILASDTTNNPVSVDIETLRRKYPYTISFAKSAKSAISIGFGDYDDVHGATLFRCMDRVLSEKNVVGQNYLNFDCHVLRTLGFNINVDLAHDTRIRHHILWPELPHKLEVLTMQYTREPYYKEEGRSWGKLGANGKKQLMRYNCKDTCVTREAFDVQELEFQDRPDLHRFYSLHEMPLARAMHIMEYRGISVDRDKLSELQQHITTELSDSSSKMGTLCGAPIAFSASDQKNKPGSINIGSTQQLASLLRKRNIKIPKARFTGNDSLAEEKLHILFAETNDQLLLEVLRTRELTKILSTYVEATLVNGVLYSDYVVGGTVTGRRSSKSWPIGFGVNHQNFPKHSKLGKKFRECLVARLGKVFVNADQVSAEDWIVQGIIADQSGDTSGVDQLRKGIDRHCVLAQKVFGLPEDQCNKTAERSGLIYRYMGKKTRHAGNYDMHGKTMSAQLSKEGFSVNEDNCDYILYRFHQVEPNIKGVFHAYVEREITDNRRLRNLFGRTRDFFGFCPWRDNSSVFREGYAYIPQGTVGDNTGAAGLFCEQRGFGLWISETHDALTLEVDANADAIFFAVQLIKKAFHRILTFPKGFELEIPIEFELGFNLKDMTACGDLSKAGLTATLATLSQSRSPRETTCSGAQLVASQQP
jgi:DNA polymerase